MTRPIEEIVRDLAVIAAARKILATAEAKAKAELEAQMTRGTVYAYDRADGNPRRELGYANVPLPAKRKPLFDVYDEQRVTQWATAMFGDSAAATQLTDQGRKSVEALVQKCHWEANAPKDFEFDGVRLHVPDPNPVTPRFTPASDIVDLVRDMFARGEISVATILELGGN